MRAEHPGQCLLLLLLLVLPLPLPLPLPVLMLLLFPLLLLCWMVFAAVNTRWRWHVVSSGVCTFRYLECVCYVCMHQLNSFSFRNCRIEDTLSHSRPEYSTKTEANSIRVCVYGKLCVCVCLCLVKIALFSYCVQPFTRPCHRYVCVYMGECVYLYVAENFSDV